MHLQVRGASCPEADWDGWLPAGLNAPTGARRFLPISAQDLVRPGVVLMHLQVRGASCPCGTGAQYYS